MARKQREFIATTQAEIAETFDVSIHTVGQWRAKGMPGEPGRYDMAKITRWAFSPRGPYGDRRWIKNWHGKWVDMESWMTDEEIDHWIETGVKLKRR